jgi:SAM-dependent methyltransferase
LNWYDLNADRLAVSYESLAAESIHGWLDGLLPTELGTVFDIGSGTGRDVAWLASLGHEVIGVEPSTAMRAQAARLHTGPRLRWFDDSLPSLSKLSNLGLSADLILVSGVWHHVAPADRARAFRKLAALLRSGGLLAITLREGPAETGREIHPTSLAELETLALAAGMTVEQVVASSDHLGRVEVQWTNVALRLPDDGTGALPLLRHLILNDQKSSTYKLGLLWALCRAADSSGGLARDVGDGGVELPLGIIALNWLRLYLPLVKANLAQTPSSAGTEGLGFVRDGFRAILAGAAGHLDLRVGSTFGADRALAVHTALWDAVDTITRMPANYLTYPNGGRIFPVARARRTQAGASLLIDVGFLHSFGTMRIPADLWRALRRFSSWIEPALVFEWTRLMKGYAAGRGRQFDDAVALAAMTWSDPERDVLVARRLAISFLDAGLPLHCVWTGRRLRHDILDIDHCLPWSAWPCGDLWNLMPSHREVNQRLKREKLPSSSG